MRIKPSTRVHSMLRVHPQLEEVLEDHDVDADEVSALSLREVCAEYGLDLDEVIDDLKASLRDSPTEGWLGVDEEEEEEDSDDYYDEEDEEEDDGGNDDEDVGLGDVDEDDDEDEAEWD